MPDETPVKTTDHAVAQPTDNRIGKLKLAFLYILIGGLVVSALISVTAILIGEFNEAVQKALLTTFILVTHSLLVLALVSADTRNQLGRSLLPTVILTSVIANMVTTTFGTWEIWGNNLSWRAFYFYMLAIGAAFIISAVLGLRIRHRATQAALYATVSLIVLLALVLTPWIFVPEASWINSFYFRLIGAVSILAATALSITVIVNRIVVSQKPGLAKVPKAQAHTPSGLMAINICIGVLVAIFWAYGLAILLTHAAYINRQQYPQQYYNQYRTYDRDDRPLYR